MKFLLRNQWRRPIVLRQSSLLSQVRQSSKLNQLHLSYSSYIMAKKLRKLKQKHRGPLYFYISSLTTMFSYAFLCFSYVLRPSANPLLEISYAFWSISPSFWSRSHAFCHTSLPLSQSIARGEALSAVHLLYSRAYFSKIDITGNIVPSHRERAILSQLLLSFRFNANIGLFPVCILCILCNASDIFFCESCRLALSPHLCLYPGECILSKSLSDLGEFRYPPLMSLPSSFGLHSE